MLVLVNTFNFDIYIELTNDLFFSTEVMDDLYNYVNPKNGKHSPLISKETRDIIKLHEDVSLISTFAILLI